MRFLRPIRPLLRDLALTALAALLVPLPACKPSQPIFDSDAEEILQSVDETIRRRDSFEESRNADIAAARFTYGSASTPEGRYESIKGLYDAYAGFRLDSALNIASRRLDMARHLRDPEKITASTIVLAQSLMSYGENSRAIAVLDSLPVESFDPARREQIYSAYFGSYSAIASSSPLPEERARAEEMARDYRDSVIALLRPHSIGHTYLTARRMQDSGQTLTAIQLLEQAAEAAPDHFRDNAAFQYGLGLMYLDEGRDNEAVTAIARASVLDLQAGKKEYASLIRLARLLYDKGDILRAFNYIKCAFEDASFSHAAIRASEIMEIMPIIDGAYRAYEDSERDRVRRTYAMTLAVGLLLIVAIAVLWIQLRRISGIKALLARSNSELSLRNDMLARADKAKVSHIEGLLRLHASNIAHNKTYRRDLLRMLAAGQYSRVSDRLKSDNVDNTETKLFYEEFDSTFLAMFPDFIEEINAYMREPFTSLHPSALTPEQRIMALMKFGHSSTADISSMLQYTQQTVYNYRSSIRNMLACPLEEFEKRICMFPAESSDKT